MPPKSWEKGPKNSGKFVINKKYNEGGGGSVNTGKYKGDDGGNKWQEDEGQADLRIKEARENDVLDSKYGFDRMPQGDETAYLINMHAGEVLDEDKRLLAAVDYYFIQEDGTRFKVSLPYRPYLYLHIKQEQVEAVMAFISKKYGQYVTGMAKVQKEDLDLHNHLVGLKQLYVKLEFLTITDLQRVRRDLNAAVRRNKEKAKSATAYSDMLAGQADTSSRQNPMDHIVDMREHDLPHHVRTSIDKSMFVGTWYNIKCRGEKEPVISRSEEFKERPGPDCIVLAFDIETTKLPLKFPDAAIDQVMMISYMIDGQGYLITNREIIGQDVEDFEYTPKPEFEGPFIVFNEEDEKATIQKFFDHVLDVRPHIFVTYNGDFFDWPFVEARALVHGMDMAKEIGFVKNKEGVYSSRPAAHMDAYCWVKRDSYLPVGSQGLKAAAKAKLRYDPVEMDMEDMCRMATEEPQVLANYSVSDAVATYYLYMKYVHPFCYALCTIIPMEPDEVLRKGSGTLCEALLCVEAFRGNIVFPNKHVEVLNKMSEDGKVLESETYVGGHVEAIECGVYRADIPCRFRMVPSAFQMLYDDAERCMKRAIEVEEGVPMAEVTNFEEVLEDIKAKLEDLRDVPARLENPIIYHLDVGAMYPNIILTNRLQPSAMVDETVCAACDFNRPGAQCQRRMPWMWRGEVMPAGRSEYQRIQQQLETEKFPPKFPGGDHRAFHQLSKEDQAEAEKKRLAEYCRKAYKRTHVTKLEERFTTICQKENSFYVDTVRAFRDRRYTYKGLCKKAKKEVGEAAASGDAAWLKTAKTKEVLYDSLQLAHKCILNSFYGYVMRKGARWYSMEMAGIVCYTGAGIIKCARELIEQIGRPLELDTDGIWCIMPASFPENYEVATKSGKKVTISYPGAMLNIMVQDQFTNEQYHELKDVATLDYEVRSENSIFFEVDGPYKAMILPASKEEGKKLKKRYAVFNFDGSLAELKGFEVKRRGELQIIKHFQSTVFEAFLKGDGLAGCFEAVARVADYWLDVLYSRGANMPDTELFELIAENKSMSKALSEYGGQKSTTISTAKRLAEFLGDQMVKDAGITCKFIISKKPDGAPVTERAIPLAIFESEPSVRQHYLRRWLKDNSLTDFDIRKILDWEYYLERLGGTIQKIITIPAALQGCTNPVPRVAHPDWLHKKIVEKNDTLKQRKMTEMFTKVKEVPEVAGGKEAREGEVDMFDIEEAAGVRRPLAPRNVTVTTSKRKAKEVEEESGKGWREVLGPPPRRQDGLKEWIRFQKKKWQLQGRQRRAAESGKRPRVAPGRQPVTLGGFLRQAKRTLLDTPWQVIQIASTTTPGQFRLWALVGSDLHCIKLVVPRTFYVNQRTAKEAAEGGVWRKCTRLLPRSHPVHHLYEYSVPEEVFREHQAQLMADLSTPDIEGIYELQLPLEFRAVTALGCLAGVERARARQLQGQDTDTFHLDWLQFKTLASYQYLEPGSYKYIYLYHHRQGSKALWGLLVPGQKKGTIFVVDTVRSNQLPSLPGLFAAERAAYLARGDRPEGAVPEADHTFDIRLETDVRQVGRSIGRLLSSYLGEKRGPTVLALQSPLAHPALVALVPAAAELPVVPLHLQDSDSLYSVLDWQRVGARALLRHYLKSDTYLASTIEHCRYFHVPAGNLPKDSTAFGADLFLARHLRKSNFVLWASPSDRPDFGGKEADDNRLLTEVDDGLTVTINAPDMYRTVCVELDIDALAVNTLLQAHAVQELEGTAGAVAFDAAPAAGLEELMAGGPAGLVLASYDETALAAPAFRVLRTMVAAWLRDVSQYRNIYADYQIVHFYRWLRNPSSLLYDPALRKTLLQLMKKLFLQLVAEFRRLGAVVVHADFNKIVLNTKKRTVVDALSYVRYITDNIKNKELFHSIEMAVVQAWEVLLWCDPANFGGIKADLKKEEKRGNEEEGEEEEEEEEQAEVSMAWNLADYLPEAGNIRGNFQRVVVGYISALHSFLGEELERVAPGATPVRRRPSTQATPGTPGPRGGEPQTPEEFCRELVGGELSQRLFGVVEKLNRKFPLVKGREEEEESIFPSLPGSHLTPTFPALEFVKAVCKVLSLDPSTEEEVRKMRRNLLKLINVGEFDQVAEWVDPCTSFLLAEVICRACNHCRDIDLCRDLHRGEKDGRPVWLCASQGCGQPYDLKDIEGMLVDALQRKVMGHTLQDLSCTKCREVTQYNMARRCKCAGDFGHTSATADTARLLRTFHGIAQHYRLPLLQDQLAWVFAMDPALATKADVKAAKMW